MHHWPSLGLLSFEKRLSERGITIQRTHFSLWYYGMKLFHFQVNFFQRFLIFTCPFVWPRLRAFTMKVKSIKGDTSVTIVVSIVSLGQIIL